MNSSIDRQMMRLLHGELGETEASELRRRIDADPSLAARFRQLEKTWQTLELPVSTVPLGLQARLRARLADTSADDLSWSVAPWWVRASTAAALVLGVLLGAGMRPEPMMSETVSTEIYSETEVYSEEWSSADLAAPLSLAESYWLVIEGEDGAQSDNGEGIS